MLVVAKRKVIIHGKLVVIRKEKLSKILGRINRLEKLATTLLN